MNKWRTSYNNTELRSCALKKLFPAYDQELEAALKDILPPIKFEDYALIPAFLQEYCNYRNVQASEIVGAMYFTRPIKYRNEFMAVLLLCYHPEKMYDLTDKFVLKGLLKTTAELLKCHKKSLSRFTSDAPFLYRTYPAFKEVVEAVHAIIMDKYKLQAGKVNIL